jgi:thiosulfate/3-mercaptopyruvate sulfurtransferase
MNMKPKIAMLWALPLFLIGSLSQLFAVEPSATKTLPPVVSTAWLADHIEDPDLVILHIGPPGSYDDQHLPGARSASLRKLITVNEAGIRDEMPPAEDLAVTFSELGIGPDSRVIIYFAEENIAWGVSRYLLSLEYAGMAGRVAYLDGGLPKWLAEQRPVTSNTSTCEPVNLEPAVAPDVLVDLEWLTSHYDKPGIKLVDGRPAEGYSGLSGHWDRLGHIPGAASVPFFSLLAEDPPYLLKSKEELTVMFQEAGVNPGDTVVAYCGTGLWASLPYLAAKYLGYEVRLYDGSFQEWAATDSLPVVASATSEPGE